MAQIELILSNVELLLSFEIILWCLIGVTLGTIAGAIPGLGSINGIAILLPLTFGLEVLSALMLLMSIYLGSMYGGRISSILINVPGESSAVATTFDGYPMTKQGKAGYALILSAIASFVGGFIGLIGLIYLTPFLSNMALMFSPPEYFSLMFFALIITSSMGGNLVKGLISLCLGLLISIVGADIIDGTPRLTFGFNYLWDGIDFIIVAIGVFGLAEMLNRISSQEQTQEEYRKLSLKELIPKVSDLIRNTGAIIRGSIVGFLIGILPGAGSTIATFMSYDLEKKISKTPEKFGKGMDQGLSSPEAANNASMGGSLVPLFSLGIPGSGTAAILLGALIMLGLQPGPLMFEKSGDIIWALIAGLMIANVVLLLMNTLLVPMFTVIIEKTDKYLVPIVSVFCFIGVYVISNSLLDVFVMILFGVLGYFFIRFRFSLATFILAVILGTMIESNFRRSLIMSNDQLSIFFTRPISLIFMLLTIAALLLPIIRAIYKSRKTSY